MRARQINPTDQIPLVDETDEPKQLLENLVKEEYEQEHKYEPENNTEHENGFNDDKIFNMDNIAFPALPLVTKSGKRNLIVVDF